MSVIDINNYIYSSDDKFIIDTNILLYLYNSYNQDLEHDKSKFMKYADFISDLLQQNAQIFISALNLTEFINVIIQREFKLNKKESHSSTYQFKTDFRPSNAYRDTINAIKNIIPVMLKSFTKINDSFEKVNLDDIFVYSEIDFNDEYFVKLVKINNLKFITHDRDFKVYVTDIDIITANKNLLT